MVWTAAIYSTLYVARPVAEFLRDRNLLRLTVWGVIALIVMALLVWVVRRRPGLQGWGALLLGAALFLAGMSRVSPVEVKLHFVEYGVLGGFFYMGFKARRVRFAALWAIVFTGLAGWIDEGIQYLLPNRWYDIWDVLINLSAGIIAVLTMVLFGRDRPTSNSAGRATAQDLGSRSVPPVLPGSRALSSANRPSCPLHPRP